MRWAIFFVGSVSSSVAGIGWSPISFSVPFRLFRLVSDFGGFFLCVVRRYLCLIFIVAVYGSGMVYGGEGTSGVGSLSVFYWLIVWHVVYSLCRVW